MRSLVVLLALVAAGSPAAAESVTRIQKLCWMEDPQCGPALSRTYQEAITESSTSLACKAVLRDRPLEEVAETFDGAMQGVQASWPSRIVMQNVVFLEGNRNHCH